MMQTKGKEKPSSVFVSKYIHSVMLIPIMVIGLS